MQTTTKKTPKARGHILSEGAAEILLNFINGTPTARLQEIAARLKTTPGQLQQIAYRNRPCKMEIAIGIDSESNGVVPMTQLRPDIQWSYVKSRLALVKNLASAAAVVVTQRVGASSDGHDD